MADTCACGPVCRALVPCAADVQMAVLRQRCVLKLSIRPAAAAAVDRSTDTRTTAPSKRHRQCGCSYSQGQTTLLPSTPRQPALPLPVHLLLQTVAMLQRMAASPAGASCASPWRETSLCATSHTRCAHRQRVLSCPACRAVTCVNSLQRSS